MNFITKQKMLKINNFFFAILFMLLFSCNIKDPDEIIDIMTIALNDNMEPLKYINNWIDKQSDKYPYPYTLSVNRSDVLGEIYYDDGFYSIDDDVFAHYLTSFIYFTDFIAIEVDKNVIYYRHIERNKEYKDFNLIYIRNGKKTDLHEYKFYETGNIPKEVTGWVYHLQGNWYVLSPFPDKE